MSTATAEKPAKPSPAPLASFLTKVAPAPKPVEKTVEAKAEESAKHEPETAKTEEQAKPAEKAVETPKTVEAKAEEKPKEDKTEKRLKDAQTWGNEEHKARLEAERKAAALEAQLARIEQNQVRMQRTLNGEDPDPQPTVEEAIAKAKVDAKILASHTAAVRQYGKAFVMETVWNDDSPYMALQKSDPKIGDRVMGSDDPVLEAIAVVREEEQKKKYGATVEEWKQNIEAELKPKLEQQILEGLKTKPGPVTNTLGNVRGGTDRTEQKPDAPTQLDLRKVFPWGASRT